MKKNNSMPNNRKHIPLVLRSVKAKICFLAFLYCITIALVSWNKLSSTGPHGGTMKKSGNYFIEMKDPDKFVYAYLLDKKLKNTNSKNVTGEVKFYLPDSTSLNVSLLRSDDGGFTCKTIVGSNLCKITFTIPGKSLTAMFENASSMVENK
ncbi:MAG: hypothetical protein JNJ41_16765 [Bacteroidia bacterium]|nr:hypothetical protein [Bacteroidia bacterium]